MKNIYILILLLSGSIYAQVDSIKIDSTQVIPGTEIKLMTTYALGGLEISGDAPFSAKQILRFTGLEVGEQIEIPGAKINNALKKLWRTNQFSDVELYATKIINNKVFLKVYLMGLPKINEISIDGVKKSKKEDIIKDNKLKKGTKITQNLINQVINSIKEGLTEKGYPNSKVDFKTKDVLGKTFTQDVIIDVNKGERAKVEKIIIEGNNSIKTGKLIRKGFKNTKQASIFNIFNSSKLIPEKYEEDKKTLIEVYNSYGFRDAKIVSDTVYKISPKRYMVKVKIDEGDRYFLGNINFVGNSVYSTEDLERVFSYKKGDAFDAVGINKKVTGSEKDDDIHTVYLDNGYLFSNIRPIEKNVKNDTIDLEIQIQEGEQATWNKVTFKGNNQTHDHVIARELMTQPGDLFSKRDIKRTFYKLGGLGFFDPQQITQDIKPNPETNTVDIEWGLAPKSSSQIEIQGGYGGGRFIGTLGLIFQNFSINNLFKGKSWHPAPLGDGQSLAIRAQAGSYFSNFSISFTEPWIGGSRPTALSLSLYNSNYKNLYVKDDSGLIILGASIGLNKLLSWPDDYFRLSQSISYQNYRFDNYPYNVGTLKYENGESNNFAYQIGISRLSAGPDPIFPQNGSDFNISLKLTPPYSLLNKSKDYKGLKDSGEFEKLYRWLEYYKIQFSGNWYKEIAGKLVLRAGGEFGYLGTYNKDVGISPFERFFMGGTGLQANRFDGREIIPMRGYEDFTNAGGQTNRDITPLGGGTIYNKYLMELRYPITMGQQAKIFALTFLEAGNTWSDQKKYKPFNLKRSAGVGVRVFMAAFGMLGFDFGYGFDSYINSPDKASGWQTHFIFGQQF